MQPEKQILSSIDKFTRSMKCPSLWWAKGRTEEQDFEVFISAIILDRNSQLRLHHPMKGLNPTRQP
jgi:hypothetical protein